jgi:hypothetical protein
MKQKNQCKRRKESLGKETDVLYPDEQFDAIALMLGHRLRVVCGGGDCRSFFELEKGRLISPSPKMNSDFPTEIVYWSRVTLCSLYYFILRFSGVGIFFYPYLYVPKYFSVE